MGASIHGMSPRSARWFTISTTPRPGSVTERFRSALAKRAPVRRWSRPSRLVQGERRLRESRHARAVADASVTSRHVSPLSSCGSTLRREHQRPTRPLAARRGRRGGRRARAQACTEYFRRELGVNPSSALRAAAEAPEPSDETRVSDSASVLSGSLDAAPALAAQIDNPVLEDLIGVDTHHGRALIAASVALARRCRPRRAQWHIDRWIGGVHLSGTRGGLALGRGDRADLVKILHPKLRVSGLDGSSERNFGALAFDTLLKTLHILTSRDVRR